MNDPASIANSQADAVPAGCPFKAHGARPDTRVPGPVYRKPFWKPRLSEVRREIASLDARRDCQRIVHLLTNYEFPFDMQRANEIALFHTFGSRSVSTLLDRTGEFSKRGQKRYDDTRLLIAQYMECGWDVEAGRLSLEQMNHIHSFFRIPNEDFLFVLWTFIDFPIQWMDDFGWRAFTAHEREAWFHYWCEIGRRMGLKDIPEDRAAFDAYVRDYEAREFVPSEASHRVAQATVDILAGWVPRPLRPLVPPISLGLVPPRLLPAIQFEAPPAWVTGLTRAALKLRKHVKRYVSLERYPTPIEGSLNRTYPGNTYGIEHLGPEYAHRDAK
ncbi:oxygenase MpaB family protein [Corallococcus sp. bb12-1]|uniref:oxygenase MpaB family protein n=1 Tax=Corallococcus sp. bb12-1 TaxID=2996784 RepID=UPI002270C5D8|nr:oxygenase MpaB family protein [Corallococcus sp. bb12-1]MCY1040584.1 oxygenase MpaB family protein [Corallococcus sp. bb12-1]